VSAKPAVSNEAVLRFYGPKLAAPLLERVVGMLVARADASIDRLDDAMLLTDAVAAHASDFTSGDWTAVAIETSDGNLVLKVSPLEAKAARELIASTELPEIGNVIEHLTSSVRHDGDTLHMTLAF
jgi:serine/threonine-protein kinase RsbW